VGPARGPGVWRGVQAAQERGRARGVEEQLAQDQLVLEEEVHVAGGQLQGGDGHIGTWRGKVGCIEYKKRLEGTKQKVE
jgi:hypothetical protein